MDIRDVLAIEIMNWTTDEESGKWVTDNGLINKSSWHPNTDIDDAWILLEQFEECLVSKISNGLNYSASILKDEVEYSGFGYSPSNAIVNVMVEYLKSNGVTTE